MNSFSMNQIVDPQAINNDFKASENMENYRSFLIAQTDMNANKQLDGTLNQNDGMQSTQGESSLFAPISIENNQQNDSANVCLRFLHKFSSFSNYCAQSHKINPKFLNSMIKLIDKYHIPFDISVTKNDKNESASSDKNNDNAPIKGANQKKTLYKKFSDEEDILLKNIVGIFGPKNWRLIASMMPNKTSRQCRDRYMNYLAPGFVHSEWSDEEDMLLAEKYLEFGPQWAKIQRFFPSRTANSIKNRYNYTVCRKWHLFNSDKKSKKSFSDSDSKFNDEDEKIENVFDQMHDKINDDIIDYGYQDCYYDNYELFSNLNY